MRWMPNLLYSGLICPTAYKGNINYGKWTHTDYIMNKAYFKVLMQKVGRVIRESLFCYFMTPRIYSICWPVVEWVQIMIYVSYVRHYHSLCLEAHRKKHKLPQPGQLVPWEFKLSTYTCQCGSSGKNRNTSTWLMTFENKGSTCWDNSCVDYPQRTYGHWAKCLPEFRKMTFEINLYTCSSIWEYVFCQTICNFISGIWTTQKVYEALIFL
jgi:hypothetical protein